jgi:repressor LexA
MNTEVALTNRQKQILDFMTHHIQSHGFPPSISEIQKQFSFKSPNSVEQHLKALARKGWIKRHPHKSRGIEITETPKGKEARNGSIGVPLVGRISAGLPLLAEENIERTIVVDKSLLRQQGRLFALQVNGDSMIKAGIYHGDILIARQQSLVQNGDIVVALLGEEATVKRFLKKGEGVTLLPENESMLPIKVVQKEDFRILGKVVATLRTL